MNATRQLTTQLVSDLRAEINRADTKASVLIAAMGLGLGTPLGLSQIAPERCAVGNVCGIAWAAACIAWLAALCCLLMALLPRYRRSVWKAGLPVASFADVDRASQAGQLPAAIRCTVLDQQKGRLNLVAELSRIILLKYRWMRASLYWFAVGTFAVTLSAFLN